MKLTFERADAVCREFVAIGDRILELAEALRAAEFSAFTPYEEFMHSFCESSADWELHRLCQAETAKNILGRPWPAPPDGAANAQLYFSRFIQERIEERDRENGVPTSEIKDRYPGEIWRYEIDPCERNRAREWIENHAATESRWELAVKEQRHRLRAEVDKHASGRFSGCAFDSRGRYEFFSSIMNQEGAVHGFRYDRKKSRNRFPVFSREVSDTFDLCWTLEDSRGFAGDAKYGLFEPCLTIRLRDLRGSIQRAAPGEFLSIRYHHVVPGFGRAYWKFFDLGELEVCIRAHLCLYGMTAPHLATGLRHLP